MGALRQVGPGLAPALAKRKAQSAAAVAGSKADQARPKPPAAPSGDPTKSGILGAMRGIAAKKPGRGGKMSKR